MLESDPDAGLRICVRFRHILTTMRLRILLMIFLTGPVTGWAQCPVVPTLTISTQAGLAAFKANYPNCTALTGSLRVTGSGITDLSDLAQITSVGSQLIIASTSVSNLEGLENLTSAAGVQIVGNPNLTSLTGLGNIADLDMRLDENNALTALTGMEHFTSIKIINLMSNTALTSLAGLENLTHAGNIWLQSLPSLTDVRALGNLVTVDEWFFFNSCTSLPNLDGLTKLETVGSLLVAFNTSLTSLKGLAGLKKITDNTNIIANAQLSVCAIKAVCDFISMPGASARIQDNLGACQDLAAVQEACTILPVTLVNLRAQEESGQALLSWETTEESNSGYFEIQKSSDAKDWVTIGSVPAKGNSQQLNRYSFTDTNLDRSVNYYRLRSVDLDQSYSLSRIVTVSWQNVPLVYPVPAVAGVWVEGGTRGGKAELINQHGQTIKTWKTKSEREYLATDTLHPGLYLIRFEGGRVLRFVKE